MSRLVVVSISADDLFAHTKARDLRDETSSAPVDEFVLEHGHVSWHHTLPALFLRRVCLRLLQLCQSGRRHLHVCVNTPTQRGKSALGLIDSRDARDTRSGAMNLRLTGDACRSSRWRPLALGFARKAFFGWRWQRGRRGRRTGGSRGGWLGLVLIFFICRRFPRRSSVIVLLRILPKDFERV